MRTNQPNPPTTTPRAARALAAAVLVSLLAAGCGTAQDPGTLAPAPASDISNTTAQAAQPADNPPTPSTTNWIGIVIDPSFYDRAVLSDFVGRAANEGRHVTIIDAGNPTSIVLDIDLAGEGSNALFANVDAQNRLAEANSKLVDYEPDTSQRDIFGSLTALADRGSPSAAGAGCTIIVMGDGHHHSRLGPTTPTLEATDPDTARRFVSELALNRLIPDLSGCTLTVTHLTSAGDPTGAVVVELWDMYALHANAQRVPVAALS